MTEKKTFQITDPDHLITLGQVLGLLTAIEAIKKVYEELKIPGLGVAKHAVIAEEARFRIQFMQDNLRTAFREWGSLEGHEVHCDSSGLIELRPTDTSSERQP